MSARTLPDPVSPELVGLLRRLKLGRCLDTLPERLTLARGQSLPHQDFLMLLLSDEVTRRDQASAELRGRAAGLDPRMRLDTWDDSAAVGYDRALWAELTSLRFLDAGHAALILGPVGTGKTHLACALGHIAIRRRYSVVMGRADRLFHQLKAARLDASYDAELRRLTRVDLLILDDLCLHRLDGTETADFYEIIAERHRRAATVATSNRAPGEWIAAMADPSCWPSPRSTGSPAAPTSSSSTASLPTPAETHHRDGDPAMTPPAPPARTARPDPPYRDDAGTIAADRTCPVCQDVFVATGRQQFCSAACLGKRAFRRRHAVPAAAPAPGARRDPQRLPMRPMRATTSRRATLPGLRGVRRDPRSGRALPKLSGSGYADLDLPETPQ